MRKGLKEASGKWTQLYEQLGSAALKLAHQGSSGYLEDSQRQAVLAWLKFNNEWNLAQLQASIKDLMRQTGRLPVFDLLPTTPSRTRSKIFGCKPSN